MSIALIGDYEVTWDPNSEPALVIHHVVRGYDAAVFDAETAMLLRDLLATQQKRIRTLGAYQAIFGAGGDLALYTSTHRRAAYFTNDQAARLAALLGSTP